MVQTGLRISIELDAKIEAVAKECDLSKNAAAKMLIGLGLKAYGSVNLQVESPHAQLHTPE